MKARVLIAVVLVAWCASAWARDAALLNQALQDSYAERAGLENDYKTSLAAQHQAQKKSDPKAIQLELGDELSGGARGGDHIKVTKKDRTYREKAVGAQLNKEWKDVNRSVTESQKKKTPDSSRESVF